MDAFGYCVAFVTELEGGLVDDTADPGGKTNFGIASRYHGIDVANMSLEDAIRIYRSEYWDKCSCEKMPLGLALMMFDGAVNQGKQRVCEWLQIAIGVPADGVIGERTIWAMRQSDIERLIRMVAGQRALAYMQAPEPQRKRFANGWRNRLVRVYLESLLLMRSRPPVML